MNKKQQETLEILKTLVNKQKKAIQEKDEEIQKLVFKSQEEIDIEIDNKVEKRLEEEIEKEIGSRKKYERKIDCGVGSISYEKPNNLQLEQLMESLESAIKTQGPAFVLQALNILE